MVNRFPHLSPFEPPNGAVRGQRGRARPRWSPERIIESAERCIARHPAAALGASFALGLLLGRIAKR